MIAQANSVEGVVHLAVVDDYQRPDLCGPCGGKCCISMPGAAMPSDIGATHDAIRDGLIERLKSGKWAIDWWEGDPRPGVDEVAEGYFLRPATAGMEGVPQDPSWGGRCTFLAPDGCTIFDSRPMGCRGLEPSDSKCVSRHSSKLDAAIAWVPYRGAVLAALEEVTNA